MDKNSNLKIIFNHLSNKNFGKLEDFLKTYSNYNKKYWDSIKQELQKNDYNQKQIYAIAYLLYNLFNINTLDVNDLKIDIKTNMGKFLIPYTRNIFYKNNSYSNKKNLSIIKDIMNNVKKIYKNKEISEEERKINNIILIFIYEFLKPIEFIKETQQAYI